MSSNPPTPKSDFANRIHSGHNRLDVPPPPKVPTVNRDDIKRWQAKKIAASLHPSLNYLFRLRRRMEKANFLPDDPYFQLVDAAFKSVHTLWIQTHYLSCTGVGRSSDKEEEDEG